MIRILLFWFSLGLVAVANAQSGAHAWDDSMAVHSHSADEQIKIYLDATDFFKDSLAAASHYGNLALSIALNKNNPTQEATVRKRLAALYLEHDLYDKALIYAYDALAIYDAKGDKEGALDIHVIVSWVYFDAGQIQKSLQLHKEILKVYQKKKSPPNLAWVTNAIGLDYNLLKDYPSAQKYFEESLTISKSLKLPERISACLNNIGMVKASMEHYDDALQSLHEAYRISTSLNDVLKQAENLNQLGITFYRMHNLDSAEYYLIKSRSLIALSKANARKEKLMDNYESSTQLYLDRKDYKSAFHFLKLYLDLKDDVISMEKSTNLTNALMIHQTQKKEQEIKLLESENKLKALQRDALAGAILLVTIIGLLLYNRQVTAQKKERQIHETKGA